jgi:glutathione peroxidase
MQHIVSFLILNMVLTLDLTGVQSLFAQQTSNESLYAIPLKTINDVPVNLSHLKGKKILFIVLPLSANDTTVSISELKALQKKYNDVAVIGVPALDLGFTNGMKNSIKSIYADQSANFTLTEGMKVKRSNGNGQSSLFQWLTQVSTNRHFNQDVTGVGQKFFVDEKGELYAVFNARIRLTHRAVDKALTRTIQN